MVNQTSKCTFVVISWRRIIMWCRTLFLVVLLQNLSIYDEHVFWIFFNPKQVMLTILGHLNVRKVVFNHASRGNLAKSSFGAEPECGGGRCLRYFDQKILIFYAEHGFWLFFNPKQVPRSNIVPLSVHHSLHN